MKQKRSVTDKTAAERFCFVHTAGFAGQAQTSSDFECPKRRPPRAATREVFGKCNIRTFVSDEVMLAYWSVLSTLFYIKLFLKADSARRVAAHRAEPYMLIG